MKAGKIPAKFKDRIEYGLYGGVLQYYITKVDGTLAQLGFTLPDETRLEEIIKEADRKHQKLIRDHEQH